MKLFGLFLVTLLTLPALADEPRPNHWTCEVNDPATPNTKSNLVKISLTEPTVTLIYFFKNNNGSFDTDSEELMTQSSLTQWRVNKKSCEISSENKSDGSTYYFEYLFQCNSVDGIFKLDFGRKTGIYTERLTGLDVERNIPLHNCKPD